MKPELIIVVLLIFLVAREIQHALMTQVLVNKIMSKDYWDYQKSKTSTHVNQEERAPEPEEPLESFDHLKY